jgi:hypothetical protein
MVIQATSHPDALQASSLECFFMLHCVFAYYFLNSLASFLRFQQKSNAGRDYLHSKKNPDPADPSLLLDDSQRTAARNKLLSICCIQLAE